LCYAYLLSVTYSTILILFVAVGVRVCFQFRVSILYIFFLGGDTDVQITSKCISLESALEYSTILWGVIDPIWRLSGKHLSQ